MTLTEIQKSISARFDYSGSAISETTNEWARRLTLINQAEDTFKRYLNGQWSFLLTSTTLTTTDGVAYVNLPSDYERGSLAIGAGGLIIINEVYYPLREKPDILSNLSTDNFCYITGNKIDGYKLNIQPTPDGEYSIPINYYTNTLAEASDNTGLTKLTSATDSTKIPDAYYLVDWVIGELYLIDDETSSKWQSYKASAQDRLINMAATDGRDQNEDISIRIATEEQGYDTFNSHGNED